MEVNSSLPQPPAHTGRSIARALIFFLGVVFVLVCGAAIVWKNPRLLPMVWGAPNLPVELAHSAILSSYGTSVDIYTPESLWYARHTYKGGELASVAPAKKGQLMVRSDNASTYVLSASGVERERTTTPLAGPAEAPNSNVIVFATRVHDDGPAVQETPSQLTSINPGEWEIRLSFPLKKTTVRVAPGYAPLFIDETHFLFFTNSGVYKYDLVAGTAVRMLDRPFNFVLSPILQSPDRSLIMVRDPLAQTTSVYRVVDTRLLLLKELPVVLTAPALSNDGLYNLERTEQGTEVWKYAWAEEEAKRIYAFPSSLAVGRILF